MEATIRIVHELNMQFAEVHCVDMTCPWYGNKDECETEDTDFGEVEYHCPVCGDETDWIFNSRKPTTTQIQELAGEMTQAVLELNQISDHYVSYFDVGGFSPTLRVQVFDRRLENTTEKPVLGSYGDECGVTPEDFDVAIFRDWIDGVAELIEKETKDE